ncbi:MAG: hypothetical protein HY277_08400 [Ignavibacteriales bacterium]|nr:hypothetical protein [Ignavibacteriales bacterium]
MSYHLDSSDRRTGLDYLFALAFYFLPHDNIVIICVMSMAAASQWPFANISIFVSRLARKNLSINFYAHHHDNLMSVGSFLMKIDLGGVLLTFLVGLNLYLAPTLIPMTVYIVLLIVFIWAIIWFFLTQYNVHLCMMNEKRDKLNTISKRMMVALEILLKEPDEVNMATFDRMKKTFDEVAVLPEWPFNTQNLVTLLTGIIVPITLTLLQLLMVKK